MKMSLSQHHHHFVLLILLLFMGRSEAQQQVHFNCPKDGHFGDEHDCSKYYHCANGRPTALHCPSGLFWSKEHHQCDWPSKSGCDYTVEKARILQEQTPTLVYMTFDDGPGPGTKEVLDALKAYDVPATFFINSDQLVTPDPKRPNQQAVNANQLIRILEEGHILADHSYDHMKHNSNGPQNAYTDIPNDIQYFGPMNSHPALTLLRQSGFDEESLHFANYTLSTIVRMPYSNNWRVHEKTKYVRHDCPGCTVPAGSSGAMGMRIADLLASRGVQVFGWDLEWNMNFNVNRLKYDGKSMFQRLGGSGSTAKVPHKVIILAHDAAFRPHEITGGNEEQKKLTKFLDMATKSGYEFRTLDTYYHD